MKVALYYCDQSSTEIRSIIIEINGRNLVWTHLFKIISIPFVSRINFFIHDNFIGTVMNCPHGVHENRLLIRNNRFWLGLVYIRAHNSNSIDNIIIVAACSSSQLSHPRKLLSVGNIIIGLK